MRRLEWSLLPVILSCLVLLCGTSLPVNALGIEGGSTHYLSTANSWLNQDNFSPRVPVSYGDILRYDFTPGGGAVRQISIGLQDTIKGDYDLFAFEFNIASAPSSYIRYYGFDFKYATVLFDSCATTSQGSYYYPLSGGPTTQVSMSCRVVGITRVANLYSLETTDQSLTFETNQAQSVPSSDSLIGQLVINPVSTISLNNNGLSADDRAWLLQNMPGASQTDITNITNKIQQTTDAINDQTDAINDQTDAINDQTDAINDQTDVINDVKDTITDDSVDTTDIDYSDISDSVPAFGPIATIVNNLIDFPRVFLTDSACRPLNTPLPEYLGADDSTFLVIPCPSSFMQPYWSAVELIENIAAAYIYLRLAIFIVRQVEYIRDPERDDEEFLDI